MSLRLANFTVPDQGWAFTASLRLEKLSPTSVRVYCDQDGCGEGWTCQKGAYNTSYLFEADTPAELDAFIASINAALENVT